mmetsp:Transcript_13350/g.37831  ORF Transcript_13350/g.37831 Transcript_13350/m.37831 type:complete len:89 (-) Transcript_13350:243-509(-)
MPGERTVVDWNGYTFLPAASGAGTQPCKGRGFSADSSSILRFVLGEGKVLPVFEECAMGMKVGGIRRIIVHPCPLSRPGVLSHLMMVQ